MTIKDTKRRYVLIFSSMIVLFCTLFVPVMLYFYTVNANAQESLEHIKKIEKNTKLIHELQKERGLSVGHLCGSIQKEILEEQRRLTDDFLHEHTEVALLVTQYRGIVNEQERTSSVFEGYTSIITHLMDTTNKELLQVSHHGIVDDKTINAFMLLDSIKENHGRGRAIVSLMLSSRYIDDDWLNRLKGIKQRYETQESELKAISPSNEVLYEARISRLAEKIKVDALIQSLFTKGETSLLLMEPQEWFGIISVVINAQQELEMLFLRKIQEQQSLYAVETMRNVTLALGATLLVAFGMIVFGVMVVRKERLNAFRQHNIDTSEDGIVFIDEKNSICFANQLGRSFFEHINHNPDVLSKEVEIHGRYYVTSKVCFDDGTSKIQWRDITLQKEQQTQLLIQNRFATAGEMIAQIAHQWRQPLNIISLTLANLEDAHEMNDLDAAMLKRSLEMCKKEIIFMSQTIDDFRDFFRADKPKEDFYLKDAIYEVLDMIKPLLLEKQIAVCVEHDEVNPIQMYGTKNLFQQVILNLITNATEAIQEHTSGSEGLIKIGLACKQMCEVTIEDNGGGICDDVREKIFMPYVSTKGPKSGTGLGLYMAQKIMTEHFGGTIEVSNASMGARFTLNFSKEEMHAPKRS